MTLELSGGGLTLDAFGEIAAGGRRVRLTREARTAMAAGRRALETRAAEGDAVYGVNTGFGLLADTRIAPERLGELQRRLLVSHAAGTGDPLPAPAVRGMLLLRANTLARGHSGARPEVVDRLLELLSRDLLPVVPGRGSVGASGDLAPLAHLALPLIGEGEVERGGERVPAGDALAEAGLEPLALEAKEGLALINGTQAMTALVALAALGARRLVRLADLIGALATDAIRGTDTAFDERIHALRPHPGQIASAANLRRLLSGSEIRESHRHDDDRVQDAYSFRCMPQVHGAVRDVLADVERKLAIEMNAVTDNPLVFESSDGTAEVLSGGNFHGEPMAFAADALAVAVAELGSLSERRIEKLTDPRFSGLPAFLVEDSGLNSGFMIAHVTAAALVSETKSLCHPASVDSIPTSAGKEDHVSMGMGAALRLEPVFRNVETVLAIELLAAGQGIDLVRPLRSSDPLEALHGALRKRVGRWREDRVMANDIEQARQCLRRDLDELLPPLE